MKRKLYDYAGEQLTLGQLAYQHGATSADVLKARLRLGWDMESALKIPTRPVGRPRKQTPHVG